MGGGSWTAATYEAVTSAKVSSGSTFAYDSHVRRTGDTRAHSDLDPKAKNSAGENIRESRDSKEHPNSLPIIVGFDSTGSMSSVPRTVQRRLPTLFTLLLEKGYATDPQIAVSTYGDATCDRVPLQFSQFESDNRIDDNVDKLYLEGGGGGNSGETSQLLLYYAAHHTATDALEKRGKKGYLFLIADERQVDVDGRIIKDVIGDAQPLGDISMEGIANAVSEKWNVFVLLIDNYSARMQKSEEFYSRLFGPDSVIIVQDPEYITETIASIIGFEEGTDVAKITTDLAESSGKEVALSVEKSLARRGSELPSTSRLR